MLYYGENSATSHFGHLPTTTLGNHTQLILEIQPQCLRKEIGSIMKKLNPKHLAKDLHSDLRENNARHLDPTKTEPSFKTQPNSLRC